MEIVLYFVESEAARSSRYCFGLVNKAEADPSVLAFKKKVITMMAILAWVFIALSVLCWIVLMEGMMRLIPRHRVPKGAVVFDLDGCEGLLQALRDDKNHRAAEGFKRAMRKGVALNTIDMVSQLERHMPKK